MVAPLATGSPAEMGSPDWVMSSACMVTVSTGVAMLVRSWP
jgi:hypothetical protein